MGKRMEFYVFFLEEVDNAPSEGDNRGGGLRLRWDFFLSG